MNIVCTFPGKYGDLLWALPAIRALSRRVGEPVDLMVSGQYGSICPLIAAQAYIGTCWGQQDWVVQDTAPMTPRVPLSLPVGDLPMYDQVLHLGYRGWPTRPLPFETLDCLNEQLPETIDEIADMHLRLDDPWIIHPIADRTQGAAVVIGFTEEWAELKMGVAFAVGHPRPRAACSFLYMPGGRFDREWLGPCAADYGLNPIKSTWSAAAWEIASAQVVLGCCSALHVLAVACGTPVVLMEPNPMRHHEIFWPLGRTGPQVTAVIGNDGQPTTDSRHTRETLERVLRGGLSR